MTITEEDSGNIFYMLCDSESSEPPASYYVVVDSRYNLINVTTRYEETNLVVAGYSPTSTPFNIDKFGIAFESYFSNVPPSSVSFCEVDEGILNLVVHEP